ncbi:MAG: ABC transporter ATP-binding protein [Bacteroidetes bacterium]|nr:ABC transporter ATP-binding protein [Bacteroidota bacterium]MBU1718845.1 ABC transporter ATP-binding protein [Bacteroidota bacterium]
MESNQQIIAKGIFKSYKDVKALEDISFSIPRGELFGFIGPDGAGKTTLFRILVTLLLQDKGEINLFGLDSRRDFRKVRLMTGYMPGRFSLYQDLSVEENLTFFATIFGTTIKENYHLIRDIYSQIEPFKKRPAGKLSGGMKQKLALSCALIHKPELLVLDEPTTGVDAVSRKEFWEMLGNLKKLGITIIVSTPYMDEASLCDRVALIQDGKIMQTDTPANIVSSYSAPLYAIRSEKMHKLINDLRTFPETASAYTFGQYIHLTLTPTAKAEDVVGFLSEKNHTGLEINTISPNIEDCFMNLMVK